MSSGSGKKKLVAPAASPLSVSITANPVAPQTPTGGIKLLIDKNRIVSVPSTKTQPIVQRQPVVEYQNVSISQLPANEDNLRICSNAGTPISFTTAPATQKILIKKFTPITGASIHGFSAAEGSEMRVKVTGEDMNRNGQAVAASGGQIKQIKSTNSLVARRMSIQRRLPVPTTHEPDSNNGQQTVTVYTTTVRLSEDQSLQQKTTSNNLIKSQFVPTVSTAKTYSMAVTAGSNVESASNVQPSTASVVEVSTAANSQFNQDQGTVSSKNNVEKGTGGQDMSSVIYTVSIANDSATLPHQSSSIDSVEGKADSVVMISTCTTQETRIAATMEAGENRVDPLKQSKTTPVQTVNKGLEESIITDTTISEEFVPKPSREMKSLQVTQAKSKILSEFMTDTIAKGKLRKRRSDSIVEAVGSLDADISAARTQIVPRKRNRRRSTILPNADADNDKELATDDSHKLEDLVIELPATRVRKIRSTKSEYALLKGDRNADSSSGAKDGAKDFFSNLNLQHEGSKTNDQMFPGDPPKPGWDRFCWRCKKRDPDLGCSSCIRSYHKACVRYTTEDPNWNCTECKMTTNGNTDIDSFTTCLKHLVHILVSQAEWNNAFNPIDKSAMPHYDKYITRHVDLSILNEQQEQKAYKNAEEFLTDVGWLVHNMSIYPNKISLLKQARALQKRAKQEVEEMEPCYECYIKANTQCEHWFREPCSKPHMLVWAKLKGYPYWPGKLYVVNSNNQAFVRFFGAHDRSWMPVKECYLFSQRDPNPPKQYLKSKLVLAFQASREDIEHHIARLREQFNTFNYGSFMEVVDPTRLEEQQRAMLPGAFLKKVKVTIKRSEGEMVAVASTSSDEAVHALPKTINAELENNASTSTKAPTKKVTSSSPRKRMTRRMSRILKSTEELNSPVTNMEGVQELMAPSSSASHLPSNDNESESRNASDVTVHSMGEKADDSDCAPKNISLLLRRGSQSWETEPLSKRRKSVVEKNTLGSAVPKTKSTATGLKAKEELQKEVIEPVAEKAIVPSVAGIKNTTLGSAKTKSVTTILKTQETQQVAHKHTVEPITLVSSDALVEKIATPVTTVNKKDTTIASNVLQQSVKQSAPVAQTFAAVTTAANSSVVVTIPATTMNTTRPPVDPLKNSPCVNATTVCVTAASSDTASKTTDASSTLNIPTSNTEISIKKEVISDDEVNIVKSSTDVLPVATKEPTRSDTSVSSSSSSTSLDVIKKPHITPPVSSFSVVKPVQQTPLAVLPVSSTAVTMVTSNQRARKSFPGGASNSKHVSSKQAASLVHNVSLPVTITTPLASHQQTIANPPQHSLIAPMNATVSIPKELVAPSTVISLIPCTEDRNDVTVASASNDNDDVLIIEEETRPPSVPSRGRKIEGNNQLPPPLMPRPPEANSSLPSNNDSTIELNRTMQLFDDSSNRVLDHIRTVMEDLLKEMSGNGSALAELATLKLNQERQQELWMREKEKQQSMFDSRLAELRISHEQEKQRVLNEQRQQLLREKQRAVQSTKLKQWCKKCFSEAHYYCCWNTSYCSAACQKKHWMEHQNDCTQDHANNARSVQCSTTVTNSVVSSDGNSSTANNIRSRSSLQISAVPSHGGSDTSNLTKRSPSNRVFPSEITATSTPQTTPVRFIPSTMAGNVGYKTPIIQSVHGRDGMVINLPTHSVQNGSNVTIGVPTGAPTTVPQQLIQKRATARDKPVQLNNQKADGRNKGYTPRKTYDNSPLPYQNTNNLLTSTISTIAPSSSTYTTVTLADAVAVSGVSPSAWNQMAMLQTSGSRQMHSGVSYVTAGSAVTGIPDGAEKAFSSVELGIRQNHPIVGSLAQQQKTVQQPTTAYMRHQQQQ